jgi:hypothetical protein
LRVGWARRQAGASRRQVRLYVVAGVPSAGENTPVMVIVRDFVRRISAFPWRVKWNGTACAT